MRHPVSRQSRYGARRVIWIGDSPATIGRVATSICLPRVCSCSMAAGRRVSSEAIMTFFHTGSCLTYLQQSAFPIGVTCYLLNLLALDGVDPDSLG